MKKYLIKYYIAELCFISGQGEAYESHTQSSANELRKIIFESNDKDTLIFLRSFFFDKERENYLKLMEDIWESDIQIFKTDQKYVNFINLEDLEK